MIIFSPGPANISERVRRALSKPDICHRDTEFEELLTSARNLLLKALKISDGYEVILLGGSGTSAIEGVVASFGGYDKKILIISNGIYGERASAIGRHYGIDVEEIKLKWGVPPAAKLVEDRLKMDDVGAVYIVHHETTTGLINPLRDAAILAKKYAKLVLTDAVSSIAGEELDIAGWGVDAAIGSANKCIRGVPGVSFVIASGRFVKTIEMCKSRSYYTDLKTHLKSEIRAQTPFTPPVQALYAFEEALKELKEEGVEKRIDRYKETAKVLRDGLRKLGIRFFLAEEFMSNTMTVVHTPEGKSYSSLHDAFKKSGFVIYASQGDLAGTTFRLGTVGIIAEREIKKFLDIFKGLLCRR